MRRDMSRALMLAALLASAVAAVGLLAGCGISRVSGGGGTPAPAYHNTSPPTQTSGPVRIATDHSTYRPNEPIRVSVINTLAQSIYGEDTRASCSILTIETQANGSWQPAQGAECPLGRIALVVEVKPGATYQATITAGYPGLRAGAFAPGIYRLGLGYSLSQVSAGEPGPLVINYSASFTIAGAPLPAAPTATAQPGGGGTGVATAVATVALTPGSP